MDWQQCKAVDRNPKKMGGVWCFADTRMPVASLFEHLDEGSTLEEFFESFPDVPSELVHEVLRFTKEYLEQTAAVA